MCGVIGYSCVILDDSIGADREVIDVGVQKGLNCFCRGFYDRLVRYVEVRVEDHWRVVLKFSDIVVEIMEEGIELFGVGLYMVCVVFVCNCGESFLEFRLDV